MSSPHRHHAGAGQRALAPWLALQHSPWPYVSLLIAFYSLLSAVILWGLFR